MAKKRRREEEEDYEDEDVEEEEDEDEDARDAGTMSRVVLRWASGEWPVYRCR